MHHFADASGKGLDWSFLVDGQVVDVPVKSGVSVNDSVAYLHNRHLSSKVRVFVDWVSELFEHCPRMAHCVGRVDHRQACDFGGKGIVPKTLRDVLQPETMEASVS